MASNGPPSNGSPQSIPGPPYPPSTQALGETPSIIPDVPVNVIFLIIFFFGGAAHMTILQLNEKKYHKKFPLNGATFGFCVTRVAATSLRMAWATQPQSIPLGLASTIFFYAGVVLLFVANLFFAQRIVRAQHPHIGWMWPFKTAVPVLIGVTVCTVICSIVAIVLQFYTLDTGIRQVCRDIQLFAATFYAILSFIPLPVVITSALARLHPSVRKRTPPDKFGQGSMRAKVIISLISGVLLTLGASFRAGTTWLPPTPNREADGTPVAVPWYLSKSAFYGFNFAIEAFIVWLWVVVRIDKRFIVPNGSNRPYSYAGGFIFAGEVGNEKRTLGKGESQHDLIAAGFSRHSLNASRKSLAASSRMSWGGVSRENVSSTIGEDGAEVEPYLAFDHAAAYNDPELNEMGWDPKKGSWALRPISTSTLSKYGNIPTTYDPSPLRPNSSSGSLRYDNSPTRTRYDPTSSRPSSIRTLRYESVPTRTTYDPTPSRPSSISTLKYDNVPTRTTYDPTPSRPSSISTLKYDNAPARYDPSPLRHASGEN